MKLGLVLIDRAMLSKSLIQFSGDGWSCVPSLLFTWGQTMVEVMKIMATSFKRSHACTATTQCPQLQQATADPRLHQGLLDTHRQVCFGIIFIHLKKEIQGGQIDQEVDYISPYVKEESD